MGVRFDNDAIGIKTNWRQNHIQARLDMIDRRGLAQPKLMEFFIADDDLEERPSDIVSSAVSLGEMGIQVVLHEPTRYNGLRVNSASLSGDVQYANTECHNALEEMCVRNQNIVGFVTHGYNPNYPGSVGYVLSHRAKDRRWALFQHLGQERYKHAMIENVPKQLFATPYQMISIARDLKLTGTEVGICVDLSALSMTYMHRIWDGRIAGRIEKIVAGCDAISIQPYFHIGDRRFIYDALPVGKGKIHFESVISHISVGVVEVKPRNELKPVEVIDSYARVLEMKEALREKVKYD